MSTSQPSPILIRTVSSPSFSSFPRSGTLISPSATCRITECPIQVLNALSILDPSAHQPDGNENRAPRRSSQWYREGTGLVRRYCLAFRSPIPDCFHRGTSVLCLQDARPIGRRRCACHPAFMPRQDHDDPEPLHEGSVAPPSR